VSLAGGGSGAAPRRGRKPQGVASCRHVSTMLGVFLVRSLFIKAVGHYGTDCKSVRYGFFLSPLEEPARTVAKRATTQRENRGQEGAR
jgi:hypothetical protein